MQLGEAQKGFSSKSMLFDSLKVYLDNKNRLQPIIGLGSIIECVKAGTHNREALYMCEVCICRLSKADMRNHIIGSLHRYNYIKAWHPHLVSAWKENSDLSKLAWILMDIAKILEGKEGPGNVQLLEVEEDVYQRMATHSENDAITLINSLRDGQGDGEPESHPDCTAVHLNHYPSQSHRIVLLGKNQRKRFKKSLNAEMISHNISSHTNESPSLLQSTAARAVLTSQWDRTQMPSEPSVLSGNCNFLDGYTGNKPLIGLFRVVECRSEDGSTYCFLCHCCRIRSSKKDILDHLTSSSHLINYLVETHPEQVEVVTAGVNDNCQVLQSLAKKVEQEEGRGELKVVNAPESLCILLTGKSYHWCIKMLSNGWTNINSRQKKETIKGPSVNTTSIEGMPEKYAVVPSKWAQRMKKRKKRKVHKKYTNTVFKVSLPLTKGAVLLERTSFSKDSLPVSCAYPPSFDPALIPSPQSQTEDFHLDSDIGSVLVNHTEHTSMCTTSQLQQELFGNAGAGAGQYMGPEGSFTVTQYQELDGHFGQSEDTTVTKKQDFYAGRNCNRHHCPQERSSNNINKDLKNEGFQIQHEGLSPAVSHIQDGSSCNSSYGCKEGYARQCYNAVSQNKVGTAVEVSRKEGQKKMSSDATQHHYQQQPQYMTQDYTSLVPGSVGHHGLSGELVPYLDAARINMCSYLGGSHAQISNTAPEPRAQFHGIKQRQLQTYMELTASHVPTAPQSYMTQPMAYQAVQVGYGVTFDPNYSSRPRINYYEQVPHAASGRGVGGMFESNSCIPPWQAPCHGANSDVNFRATGLSGLTISEGDNRTAPLMHYMSHFEFCT